jgi:hypothetical protein
MNKTTKGQRDDYDLIRETGALTTKKRLFDPARATFTSPQSMRPRVAGTAMVVKGL